MGWLVIFLWLLAACVTCWWMLASAPEPADAAGTPSDPYAGILGEFSKALADWDREGRPGG